MMFLSFSEGRLAVGTGGRGGERRGEGSGAALVYDIRGGELQVPTRKVDVRLPGEENSNSHGARPVHLIVSMIKWIRTGGLSIKNSLSAGLHSGLLGDFLNDLEIDNL